MEAKLEQITENSKETALNCVAITPGLTTGHEGVVTVLGAVVLRKRELVTRGDVDRVDHGSC